MKAAERFIKNRLSWLLVALIWSAIVTVSAIWNTSMLQEHAYMMARERGKNFFEMVQLARRWNAEHGPVYLPVTDKTPPNPYLNIPNRDVTTTTGQELTVVNPAYMTRQMSELANRDGLYFHLTSLNPIRPGNEADPWEREALKTFHEGVSEHIEVIESEKEGEPVFRYMAPMRVESSCLPCHAVQGYRIGDIRGGLSVNLDAGKIFGSLDNQKNMVLVVHGVAWLTVLLLLYVFLNAARKHTLFLEGLNVAKQKDLQHHKQQVGQRERELQDLVNRDTTTGLHTAEHFKQLSTMLWNNAINNHAAISIILLEIDHFRDYIDNYGALEGDICLKQVTEALTSNIRGKGSVMARFGSASFIVMLSGAEANEAIDEAQKVHGAVLGLEIPHETSEVSRYVTITGAVSTTHPQHGDMLSDFVLRVRQCLGTGSGKRRNHIRRC